MNLQFFQSERLQKKLSKGVPKRYFISIYFEQTKSVF